MTDQPLHTAMRPRTLDTVCGQAHVVKPLQQLLSARGSRAFLFCGPSGTGKTTFARIIASELGCEDVLELDAASNNGVEDTRKLVERASYRSLGGGRCIVVDECHTLSKQAWQPLLKAVEEAGDTTVWVFCTTEENKVPAAIKTRCSSFTLRPVTEDMLLSYVRYRLESAEIDVPDEVLKIAVHEAGGSPRQAWVNVATVRESASADDARASLNRAPTSVGAIDLARLLFGSFDMGKARAMLKEMKDENPESVRIVVFAYAQSVALGNTGGVKPLQVMGEFEKPAIETNRIGDILLRVARLDHKWKRS